MEEINSSSLSQLKFYNEHKNLAYGTVKKYVKDSFDIDDIVQKGFMKIFSHPEYLNNTKNLNGYLHVIFKNTSIDFLRKVKYNVEYDDVLTAEVIDDVGYK